jgi:hypothetical protein
MSTEQWWNCTYRVTLKYLKKILYSESGRWIDVYRAMVEWY